MQAVRPRLQSSDEYNIEHDVSKMDTLAGLAIKYGVEVADIKKVNGLVTDHQMFALKTLLIPMPGKHPPSPLGNSPTSSNRPHDDFFDSFSPFSSPKFKPSQPRASPRSALLKATELAAQGTVKQASPEEKQTPTSPNFHRKSRSFAVENLSGDVNIEDAIANATAGDGKVGSGNSVRRRQKADTDTILLNSDLTTKKTNSLASMRKSSSTSNLEESECNSPMWPSSMKPDSLPKPLGAVRIKAALD